MTVRRWWTALFVVVSTALTSTEWATWKASREALPPDGTDSRRIMPGERVLVLGCPLPMLQRWRVRIAVRSTDPDNAILVFSGGAVKGQMAEAQTMANYAIRKLGVPSDNVIVEDKSTTTVENIVNSAPLLADGPAIKIASNTFHARRARHILRRETPELARRLIRARDYLPMEYGPLHAGLIIFEGYRERRARSAAALQKRDKN